MIVGVADTHAALWHLYDGAKLSHSARSFFDRAGTERTKIGLSTISLVEVVYLVEKHRLPESAYEELKKALDNPNHILEEVSFTAEIAAAMRKIPRDAVPDMPDRIVAATAVTCVFQSSAAMERFALRVWKQFGENGSRSGVDLNVGCLYPKLVRIRKGDYWYPLKA